MTEHKKWCPSSQSCNCGAREGYVHDNENSMEEWLENALAEERQQGREEERERIKAIDWTISQTGIAIGTKKAVIEEVLRILDNA